MELIECTKCKKEKPIEGFNFKIKSLGIRQCQCKDCTRLYIKNHYNKNKDYYLNKAKDRNIACKIKTLSYIKEYLNTHPCIDCGESDISVLEFDHNKNKGDKTREVSFLIKYRYSLNKIINEIKKCDVRCSNCHKKKTAKEFNWLKVNLHPW